jgi:hypothetical protein
MPRARNRRTPVTWGATALLIGAVALGGCGESKQEKAKAEVCAARKSIQEQVTKLQGLTLSSSSIDEAKSGLEKIGDEVRKIKGAQGDLAPERKAQVEAATTKFGEEFKNIATQFASSALSGGTTAALQAAEPKVKSALETLAGSFSAALGPISC